MLKTIVIGIDGCSWHFLDPLLAAGQLPTLGALAARGIRSVVRSTIPTISPVAWSSFISGMLPRRHQVLDWYTTTANGTRRPVSSLDRRGASFWSYLNDVGLRTGVLNLPATFPARPLDGVMTAGFDAPNGAVDAVYPTSLGSEIRQRFGLAALEHPAQSLITTHGPQAYVDAYLRHDQQLTEAALALTGECRLDVLVMNYQTVDHFNHHVPDDGAIDTALRNIDACLARLSAANPDAAWIIMSDHGSRRTTRAFLLLDWLEAEGFVVLDRHKLHATAVAQGLRERLGTASFLSRATRAAIGRAARLLPEAACAQLIKWTTKNGVQPVWPVPFVDAERSIVVAVSPGTCGFYLNPHARQANPEVMQQHASRLTAGLRALADPTTGTPLFSQVHTRQELFAGCEAAELPDLVAVSNEADSRPVSTSLFPRRAREFFVNSHAVEYYGGHTLDGIGLFAAPAFRAMSESAVIDLWDLPPLILYLHGVPIPDNFDGKVPEALFTDEFRGSHRLRTQTAKADHATAAATLSDNAEIEERLRTLGYL